MSKGGIPHKFIRRFWVHIFIYLNLSILVVKFFLGGIGLGLLCPRTGWQFRQIAFTAETGAMLCHRRLNATYQPTKHIKSEPRNIN